MNCYCNVLNKDTSLLFGGRTNGKASVRICILLFSLLVFNKFATFFFILLLRLLFFFTSPLSPSQHPVCSPLSLFELFLHSFFFSFPPHFLFVSFTIVSLYLLTIHPYSFPSFSYSQYSSYLFFS